MTRQDNFTTVEPMTEAEAMQAAREKLIFGKIHIKEIALLIGWKVDNGQKFLEAREEVFAIEEEEGGWFEPRRALRQNPHQFDEWVKNQKARTLNEYLCYCFPEITKETAEKIIELDRERCKIKSIEVGRKEYVSLKRSEVVFKQRLEKAEAIVKKVAPNPLKHLEDEEHPEVWTKVDVGYMNEYNKLLAVVFNMLQRKETNRREIYSSKNFTPFHRQHSRSPRRAPVRSAAKAGDDGGGDGDSDSPGDPPGPKQVLPSHNSPTLTTPQRNSSTSSRIFHPCSWCMDWRRTA